jgi:hypothetical protein
MVTRRPSSRGTDMPYWDGIKMSWRDWIKHALGLNKPKPKG